MVENLILVDQLLVEAGRGLIQMWQSEFLMMMIHEGGKF
jgi:hypothetical protein